MNVESTGINCVCGDPDFIFRMSVMENGPTPQFTEARVLPSGARARPYGFGAPTLTSIPTGVTSRPLGSTAASTPLAGKPLCLAGAVPAGALNPRRAETDPD